MDYTSVEMTNDARERLERAYEALICDPLRGYSKYFDEENKVAYPYSNRMGMDKGQYFYALCLSIDKVPVIMLNGRLPHLEQTLARLDIVDGSASKWGSLANALLCGLGLDLNKQDTVRKYPNEEWGFLRYYKLGEVD